MILGWLDAGSRSLFGRLRYRVYGMPPDPDTCVQSDLSSVRRDDTDLINVSVGRKGNSYNCRVSTAFIANIEALAHLLVCRRAGGQTLASDRRGLAAEPEPSRPLMSISQDRKARYPTYYLGHRVMSRARRLLSRDTPPRELACRP